nr:2-amino-4-hydroxy-6-hydroxymethyldihydropteridine diphosphokinase [Tepidiphilus baoligensis]
MTPVLAHVALGANLGDAEATVRAAIAALGRLPDTQLVAASSLYRTAPVGVPEPQPDYINAVARVATTLPPEALLDELLALEARFGRIRPYRWAPRALDLDCCSMAPSCSTRPASPCPILGYTGAPSCSNRCSNSTPPWKHRGWGRCRPGVSG